MKKSACAFLSLAIAFLICLLSSCSSSEMNKGAIEFDPYSDQVYFTKSTGGYVSMVSAEIGYYFTKGTLKYLYFTDRDTLKTVPLCNKPDCPHDGKSANLITSNCNAYLGSIDIGDLLYYDSYIYYVRMGISPNFPVYLSQISLDGTQHKDVHKFKVQPHYMAIHRGYLYYATMEDAPNDDMDEDDLYRSCVYRVPMNDLKKQPEVIYEINGIWANIARILGYGDSVYFSSSRFLDKDALENEEHLLKYSIETGILSEIDNNTGRLGICGGKLAYSMGEEQMAVLNLDGSERKILDGVFGAVNSDDKYIITDTIPATVSKRKDKNGNPIQFRLSVYDLNGKELQSFNLEKYNVFTYLGSDGANMFLTTVTRINETRLFEFWRIDKSKIADGTAKMEKYYEYVEDFSVNQ